MHEVVIDELDLVRAAVAELIAPPHRYRPQEVDLGRPHQRAGEHTGHVAAEGHVWPTSHMSVDGRARHRSSPRSSLVADLDDIEIRPALDLSGHQ